MTTSVLRPGLLVSLKTTVKGGVNYQRVDLEKDHETEDGARRARWETVRTIPDPEEFERATQARANARAIVAAVCVNSAFGLLCPNSKEEELWAAVERARDVVESFNRSASLSRLGVYVLVGRIAQDELEAVRAIRAEVTELLDRMQAGIRAADPEAIRDAATKARQLGAMLTDEAAGKVSEAVLEARRAAREITRRVEKSGEQAAKVIGELSMKAIDGARFAFLDLDATGAPVESEAPQVHALDLAPASESAPQPAPVLALDFGE